MAAENVLMVQADRNATIEDLCSDRGISFTSGCGFYELTKTEKVSSSKDLIARDPDGYFHHGAKIVREKLSLSGEKIAPGDVPDGWVLFVNSTSRNRGIPKGNRVAFLTDGPIEAAPAKPAKAAAAPKASKPAAAPKAPKATAGKGKKAAAAVSDDGEPLTGKKRKSDEEDDGDKTDEMDEDEVVERVSKRPKRAATAKVVEEVVVATVTTTEVKTAPAKKVVKSTVKTVTKVTAITSERVFMPTASDTLPTMPDVGARVWAKHGTMLTCNLANFHSDRIAAFDMDSTLIETKSGNVFPKNKDDWQLMMPDVAPTRLAELVTMGYKIVIFTNQGGIAKGKSSVGDMQNKISNVCAALGVPIQVFVATDEDNYRKPQIDMWEFMESQGNGGVAVDRSLSVYVGDGAGRAASWAPGRKKDFSASDRKFAMNVGTNFATPEEFFLGHAPVPFTWDGIDPRTIEKEGPLFLPADPPLTSSSQEVILIVGFPASGKSTFSKTHIVPHGYIHVNRDTLKTKEKCIKVARESLAAGKSVVIDNTNPSAAVRREYIEVAQEAGVPVRCYVMQTSLELAEHLNMYREKSTNGEHAHVPGIGYRTYTSQYSEPELEEGFAEIKQIFFRPTFKNAAAESLFNQFT